MSPTAKETNTIKIALDMPEWESVLWALNLALVTDPTDETTRAVLRKIEAAEKEWVF